MTLHLISLENTSIYKQLQIEEALIRADDKNYCLINHGSNRAIIMGISGRPDQLINTPLVKKDNIHLIKRFSGGGTVIVDNNTFFVTFIFNKDAVDIASYPEPIMRWAEKMFQQAFSIDGFHLKENDFVIGQKKCGGNAQYIQNKRWLHHVSFLWDYCPNNMDYLLFPKKTPKYREDREHHDFLCSLKQHITSKNKMSDLLVSHLQKTHDVVLTPQCEITPLLELKHRKSTQYIQL